MKKPNKRFTKTTAEISKGLLYALGIVAIIALIGAWVVFTIIHATMSPRVSGF